jgi:hypothetical protein
MSKKGIAQKCWQLCERVASTTSNLLPPTLTKKGASISFVGTRKFQPADKISHTMYQTTYNTQHYKPLYFNSNIKNEEQALQQRVIKQTPELSPLKVNFEQFVRKHLFDILPYKRIRSDNIHTYLKNSNSSTSVKAKILIAYNALEQAGLNQKTSFTYDDLYKMTTRASFVKVEAMLYNSEGGTKQKAPRLIQGASPAFVALVGPWFSAFQRYMKQIMNKNYFAFFTSGANSRDMGKFFEGIQGNVFENDISAYDASIGKYLCDLEVWIAKQFKAPTAVIDLMTANIKTHGFTQNGWKYNVEGTRKSGDPYTSCFNSLLNVLMHCFVYFINNDVTIDELKEKIHMVVQGDDNLMIHQGEEFNWRGHFLELGFDTVSTYRSDLFEAEFCSSIVVPVAEGLTFIPKFGRVLAKFGYFINPPKNIHPKAIIKGVCLGFSNLTSIPFFKQLITTELFFSGNHPAYTDKRSVLEHKILYSKVTSTEMTDLYMAKRYGFSLTQLEQACDQLVLINVNVTHPFLKCLLDKDTDGPQVIYCD